MPEDRFSEDDHGRAVLLRWRARELAGCNRVYPPRELLSVPPEWTALLLMKKAGTPPDLIQQTCGIDEPALKKRLRTATLLMIYPPYAARIEHLMNQMPRFDEGRRESVGGAEETCAHQG